MDLETKTIEASEDVSVMEKTFLDATDQIVYLVERELDGDEKYNWVAVQKKLKNNYGALSTTLQQKYLSRYLDGLKNISQMMHSDTVKR